MIDYYQILGIDNTATPEEIEEAYQKLIKKLNSATKGGTVVSDYDYRQAQMAYRILISEKERTINDNSSNPNDANRRKDYEDHIVENPFEDDDSDSSVDKTEFRSENTPKLSILIHEYSQTSIDTECSDAPEDIAVIMEENSRQPISNKFFFILATIFGVIALLFIIYNQKTKKDLDLKADNPTAKSIIREQHVPLKDDSAFTSESSALSLSADDALTLIKDICDCNPVSVSKLYQNDLFYLRENKSKDESDNTIILENIRYENGRWSKINSQKIPTGYYDILYSPDEAKFKPINYVNINGVEYFYAVLGLGQLGTSNNGFDKYAFIFVNPEKNSMPVVITYERSADKSWGEFSVTNGGKLPAKNAYVAEAMKCVVALYGPDDRDINSIKNFNLKWEKANPVIYKSINSGIKSIPVQITKYPGRALFSKYSDDGEKLMSDKYVVSSGFASPILAYDKHENTTSVLFVPEGWPLGCCWGYRSFTLESFDGRKVIAADSENTIIIDLSDKIISISPK